MPTGLLYTFSCFGSCVLIFNHTVSANLPGSLTRPYGMGSAYCVLVVSALPSMLEAYPETVLQTFYYVLGNSLIPRPPHVFKMCKKNREGLVNLVM